MFFERNGKVTYHMVVIVHDNNLIKIIPFNLSCFSDMLHLKI